MERQDIWVIVLSPFAALAMVWALGAGECKRVGEGTFRECAIKSVENFGHMKMLYEDAYHSLFRDVAK